jgi:hypothetical protein
MARGEHAACAAPLPAALLKPALAALHDIGYNLDGGYGC